MASKLEIGEDGRKYPGTLIEDTKPGDDGQGRKQLQ